MPIFSLHKFIDRVFPETSTVNATTNNIPSSDLMSLSSSLNLLGLLLEKQGMFEDAARSLFRANFIISEARKRTSLERTAVIEYKIKENLARVLCSSGQFADSVALYNELEGNLTRGVGEIGFGLALFFSGKLPESFSLLEKGLISCSEPGCFQAAQDEVMVMVAQILYALGTDQHISLSKRQLLDGYVLHSLDFVLSIDLIYLSKSVSKNNLNLRALFGLCALGLVKGDMALAQNAAAELIGIPPDLLSKAGLEGDVELVLSNLFLIQVLPETAIVIQLSHNSSFSVYLRTILKSVLGFLPRLFTAGPG